MMTMNNTGVQVSNHISIVRIIFNISLSEKKLDGIDYARAASLSQVDMK